MEEMIWIKFEVILSKFREEVCHNPDADIAPYTQMLVEAFRERKGTWERTVIGTLFLNLYGMDVQSLRTDLCKLEQWRAFCNLEESDAEKDKFPQRIRLLKCLYKTVSFSLSFYLGKDFLSFIEDFSSISAVCDGAVEVDRETFEMILSEFKEEVCHNPDTDVIPYIQKLVAEYNMMEAARVERVIHTLFRNLYEGNAQSLRIDLTKVMMLDTANAASLQCADRAELLQCLYRALSSHIGEDFSDIIAMCDQIEHPGMER